MGKTNMLYYISDISHSATGTTGKVVCDEILTEKVTGVAGTLLIFRFLKTSAILKVILFFTYFSIL